MRWSNLARSALFSVAICCVAMPEAEAIEIFAPPGLSARVADGMVTQVEEVAAACGVAARIAEAARVAGGGYRGRAGYGYRGGARVAGGAYRGGYGRYGYRGGYGYRGYGYAAAAVGAAAVTAHHCWINSYGHRGRSNYNYY